MKNNDRIYLFIFPLFNDVNICVVVKRPMLVLMHNKLEKNVERIGRGWLKVLAQHFPGERV